MRGLAWTVGAAAAALGAGGFSCASTTAGRDAASGGAGTDGAETRPLREKDLRAPEDLTCSGSSGSSGGSGGSGGAGLACPDCLACKQGRVVPDGPGLAQTYGVDEDGGSRAIALGVRVLFYPDGSALAAEQRLPGPPASVVAVPERMGGGFFYALDRRLWRSDTWLGKTTPVGSFATPIDRILVGLDRIYVHSPQGGLVAVVPEADRAWSVARDLGPLPRAPFVARFAAADAWNALAIVDFQGALVTSNAGTTWRPVPLPIAPVEVRLTGDGLVVGGLDEARKTQWWQVRPDGQTTKLETLTEPKEARSAAVERPPVPPLGASPLKAALEEGFPLQDGTALVLRDGAAVRVRLSDGKVVEAVYGAFPLKPATCHGFSLASPRDRGAFGYACGEPRARTVVYRWDTRGARPVELRRFGEPRVVLAFGNGALAAKGPCASPPRETGDRDEQTFCVMPPATSPDPSWREVRFRGDESSRARLVVLADGRAVVVRPPVAGDLSTAHLAFVSDARASELPLTFPEVEASVASMLRGGIWRDGFEERRPGVLGGWVDDADSVLGIEIAVDGKVAVGQDVQESVMPIVSGRWGLVWTASRRGLQTVDGGMTWRGDLDLPLPLSRNPPEVSCGPIGCVAAGWLRVGWGTSDKPVVADPRPSPHGRTRGAPALSLACEARSPAPPVEATTSRATPSSAPPVPWYAGQSSPPATTLPPFGPRRAPALPPGDAGVSVEARTLLDKAQRTAGLARIYAWGPRSGDWDGAGRWQVAWQSPWRGWEDARSTAETEAPWSSVDAAKQAIGVGGVPFEWALEADDADHALLVGRRSYGATRVDLVALEANHAPVEVRRAAGEPIPDVEGWVRSGGRWYLASSQGAGETQATVLWAVDGGTAREVARLPRLGLEPHAPLRLVGRDGGRTIGVLVDGQPATEGQPLRSWVFPVDVETGAVGEPELLGAADLSDRPVTLCTGDDAGWIAQMPYPGSVSIQIGAFRSSLQAPLVRMRLSREGACLVRVLGSVDPWALARPSENLVRSAKPAPSRAVQRTVEASVFSARTRYALACGAPQP